MFYGWEFVVILGGPPLLLWGLLNWLSIVRRPGDWIQ